MCRSLVVILLLFWKPIYGSIVEINETHFKALPPLFALDEWSACQEPGDVYCMVDAKLVSKEPSPILALLQEYSKQSLKHYNRTLIHRGMCMTQCGSEREGWAVAAERCLNVSLQQYGLQAEVLSVDYCSTAHSAPSTTSGARALAVACTVLLALACLATTLHALAERCGKPDCNKYLLAFSVKRNWEILTYDRSKPRTDDRMKDIACIEGIRVLGMQCVIFSHVMFIYVYSYTDNPHYIEKMYDQLGWKIVLNSPVWLQAFFSLSGFLTAYTVLITAAANPLTVCKCAWAVVNRWIRLTPLAAFALWFTISWFPALGSGPQWAWTVGREARECSERWWYHLLYVHNHLPLGKFCMGHTWYLAADMQLHFLGLVLLLLLVNHQRAVPVVLALLVTGASVGAAVTVYCLHLAPIITGQAPEVLRRLFWGARVVSLLYVPAWSNLPGYLGGVGVAFLLHRLQGQGVKLNQHRWFKHVFHLSLPLGSCVVAGGAVFLSDNAASSGWAGALYAGVDRTLCAVCFNVFLLGCVTGCPSALGRLVAWRGWHAAGRLSYCVLLAHFLVLRLTLPARLLHASVLAFICLLITTSVLSYTVAIPLTLLIELPFIQLYKAATGADKRPPAPAPGAQVPPTHDVKPFDLVANVRRRLDAA